MRKYFPRVHLKHMTKINQKIQKTRFLEHSAEISTPSKYMKKNGVFSGINCEIFTFFMPSRGKVFIIGETSFFDVENFTKLKITASDVNKLRQSTGAGMMDCKNALVEAEGDFDKAIDVLRKKGQKVAAKRADRDSSEGAAVAKVNSSNTMGVAIVLGCETDFVGKNENFLALANKLAEIEIGRAHV